MSAIRERTDAPDREVFDPEPKPAPRRASADARSRSRIGALLDRWWRELTRLEATRDHDVARWRNFRN